MGQGDESNASVHSPISKLNQNLHHALPSRIINRLNGERILRVFFTSHVNHVVQPLEPLVRRVVTRQNGD